MTAAPRLGKTTATAATNTGTASTASTLNPSLWSKDSLPVVHVSVPPATASHDAVEEIGRNESTTAVVQPTAVRRVHASSNDHRSSD